MASNTTEMVAVRKYLAELMGTFALVFFGCGSVAISNSALLGGVTFGLLAIAFAFGVTVLVMVYAIGSISGCHINPAITIAMLVAGKISPRDTVGYILAQCVGAIFGAGVLLMILSGMPHYDIAVNGLGTNGYGAFSLGGFSATSAFLAEVVLTFFFLIVIFGATSEEAPKGFAGIAIGLTLFIIHIVGIPIDGTSVNPARSLGPALFVGGHALDQLWLFLVAPVIGGIIAALAWTYVLHPALPAQAGSTTA